MQKKYKISRLKRYFSYDVSIRFARFSIFTSFRILFRTLKVPLFFKLPAIMNMHITPKFPYHRAAQLCIGNFNILPDHPTYVGFSCPYIANLGRFSLWRKSLNFFLSFNYVSRFSNRTFMLYSLFYNEEVVSKRLLNDFIKKKFYRHHFKKSFIFSSIFMKKYKKRFRKIFFRRIYINMKHRYKISM